MERLGYPAYRGRQGFEWIWRKQVDSYTDISVWPIALRERMQEQYPLTRVKIEEAQQAHDATTKVLFQLADGQRVETVILPHSYGTSICVSSQVGCNIGCKFCASGLLGKTRNLSAGEILDQVAMAHRALPEDLPPISRVDLMGIGEPLDNYQEVLRFVRLIHEPLGVNMSYRHITLSTSGLVPAIYRLADEGLPLTLAVSLHAPDNELRSQIMPINRAYPLEKLIPAARYYAEKSGRRVTFEYAMLKDVNDDQQTAKALVALLSGLSCHVNLIPWNPVPEQPFQPSPMVRVRTFRDIVQQNAISCTIRKELGQEIDAACGQLRHREEAGRPEGIRELASRIGERGEPR
jgi:23S rRNA (adenine2503-C2)-methyltransferase